MKENYYIETLQKAFPFLYLLTSKNKILIFFFPFYFFLLTFSAFNTIEPEKTKLEIAAEDASCTDRIRGNGLNDIFVAGDLGLLAHFNGVRRKLNNEFLFSASSLSVTLKKKYCSCHRT